MTFEDFSGAVRDLVEGKAQDKGYNETGPDGPNELFDFVYGIAGDGHALGEIVYKAKRYARKHNPEDLLKAAAWAYLILKHAEGRLAGHETRDLYATVGRP